MCLLPHVPVNDVVERSIVCQGEFLRYTCSGSVSLYVQDNAAGNECSSLCAARDARDSVFALARLVSVGCAIHWGSRVGRNTRIAAAVSASSATSPGR